MAATVAEFHAKHNETVTLPRSGLVVDLQVPDMMAIIEAGEELPIPPLPPSPDSQDSQTSATDQASVRRGMRMQEAMIASGVINPPMSCVRDEQGRPVYSRTVYVHVAQLSKEDADFLAARLNTKLGLTPEVRTAIDTFRSDPEREGPEGVGGALPGAAVGAAEAHTPTALFQHSSHLGTPEPVAADAQIAG